MIELDTALDELHAHVAGMFPGRVVTRSYMDFSARPLPELNAGVYTLVFRGFPSFKRDVPRWASPGRARILLLGQFVLAEDAAPADVEAGEIAMMEEVIAAVRSAPEPKFIGLGIEEMATSAQLEHPYGWVAAMLEMDWIKQF